MTAIKLTNEQLANMSPWQIAEHHGIGYSGDMDPLNHGGFFYSISEWENWGYASCVEFWHDDDENNVLVVQPGTINKPDDMEGAFRCYGIGPDDENRQNIHCQIECVKAYCGMEPEGTEFPNLKSFRLEDWKERNVWKSVRGWIESLAS